MHPIYVAAAITVVVTVAFWLALFHFMAGAERRLAPFALLTLPFSFAVNLWVKGPVYRAVAAGVGITPDMALATLPLWFLVFRLLLPPVTEEAIKAAPVLAPPLRARLTGRRSALWLGMYLGVGFGLGEIVYLAWRLAEAPALAGYPFWAFAGFLNERLMATFGHGVLTAVLLTGTLAGPRGAVAGYLGAVGLHTMTNLGALLGKMGTTGPLLTYTMVIAAFIVQVLVFLRLHGRSLGGQPAKQEVLFRRPPGREKG